MATGTIPVNQNDEQVVRHVSLKFATARTIPANTLEVITSSLDLDSVIPSGWNITYVAVVYIQGNVCYACNHTVNSNKLYLSIRNPTASATTVNQIDLYVFASRSPRLTKIEIAM